MKWDVRGASSGEILPEQLDIFKSPSPELDIHVKRDMSYQLNVEGSGIHIGSVANIYVSPPKIEKFEFDIKTRILFWDVLYSSSTTLKSGNIQKDVASNDQLTLPTGDYTQAVLKATGSTYTLFKALSIEGLSLETAQYFDFECQEYQDYFYTTFKWKSKEVNQAELYISLSNDTWFKVAQSTSGDFEYTSNGPVVSAKLCLTKSDGSKYPDLILKKEAF